MSGFVAIDCETTGLVASYDRMIEIACVQISSTGYIETRWSSLLNPGRPVGATFIHGFTDDDVAEAPTFAHLLPQICNLLAGRAVVAHNAEFDLAFLNAEFRRAGLPLEIPLSASICTMELSKIYLPPGRHSLVAAAARAGIHIEQHHRALDDALTSAKLLDVYMRAETAGQRYAQCALSRNGRITNPASWNEARLIAESLAWPQALL